MTTVVNAADVLVNVVADAKAATTDLEAFDAWLKDLVAKLKADVVITTTADTKTTQAQLDKLIKATTDLRKAIDIVVKESGSSTVIPRLTKLADMATDLRKAINVLVKVAVTGDMPLITSLEKSLAKLTASAHAIDVKVTVDPKAVAQVKDLATAIRALQRVGPADTKVTATIAGNTTPARIAALKDFSTAAATLNRLPPDISRTLTATLTNKFTKTGIANLTGFTDAARALSRLPATISRTVEAALVMKNITAASIDQLTAFADAARNLSRLSTKPFVLAATISPSFDAAQQRVVDLDKQVTLLKTNLRSLALGGVAAGTIPVRSSGAASGSSSSSSGGGHSSVSGGIGPITTTQSLAGPGGLSILSPSNAGLLGTGAFTYGLYEYGETASAIQKMIGTNAGKGSNPALMQAVFDYISGPALQSGIGAGGSGSGNSMQDVATAYMHTFSELANKHISTPVISSLVTQSAEAGIASNTPIDSMANIVATMMTTNPKYFKIPKGAAQQEQMISGIINELRTASVVGNVPEAQFAANFAKADALPASQGVNPASTMALQSTLTQHGFMGSTSGTWARDIWSRLLSPTKGADTFVSKLQADGGPDMRKFFGTLNTKGDPVGSLISFMNTEFTGSKGKALGAKLSTQESRGETGKDPLGVYTIEGARPGTYNKKTGMMTGGSPGKYVLDVPDTVVRALQSGNATTQMSLQLINSIRGGGALSVLTNAGLKDYEANYKKIINSKDNPTLSAQNFSQFMSTPGGQFLQLEGSFKSMEIMLGTTVAPLFKSIVATLTPFFNEIGKLAKKNPTIAKDIAIGSVGALALGPFIRVLKDVGTIGGLIGKLMGGTLKEMVVTAAVVNVNGPLAGGRGGVPVSPGVTNPGPNEVSNPFAAGIAGMVQKITLAAAGGLAFKGLQDADAAKMAAAMNKLHPLAGKTWIPDGGTGTAVAVPNAQVPADLKWNQDHFGPNPFTNFKNNGEDIARAASDLFTWIKSQVTGSSSGSDPSKNRKRTAAYSPFPTSPGENAETQNQRVAKALVEGKQVGQALAQGVVQGYNGTAIAQALFEAVHIPHKSAWKIASPSKVMVQVGEDLARGLLLGYNQGLGGGLQGPASGLAATDIAHQPALGKTASNLSALSTTFNQGYLSSGFMAVKVASDAFGETLLNLREQIQYWTQNLIPSFIKQLLALAAAMRMQPAITGLANVAKHLADVKKQLTDIAGLNKPGNGSEGPGKGGGPGSPLGSVLPPAPKTGTGGGTVPNNPTPPPAPGPGPIPTGGTTNNVTNTLTAILNQHNVTLQQTFNTFNNSTSTTFKQTTTNFNNTVNTFQSVVQNTISTVQNTYNNLSKALTTINNTVSNVKNEYDTIRNAYSTVNNAYTQVKNTYDTVKNTYDSIRNSYSTVNNTYNQVKNIYNQLTTIYNTLKESITELTQTFKNSVTNNNTTNNSTSNKGGTTLKGGGSTIVNVNFAPVDLLLTSILTAIQKIKLTDVVNVRIAGGEKSPMFTLDPTVIVPVKIKDSITLSVKEAVGVSVTTKPAKGASSSTSFTFDPSLLISNALKVSIVEGPKFSLAVKVTDMAQTIVTSMATAIATAISHVKLTVFSTSTGTASGPDALTRIAQIATILSAGANIFSVLKGATGGGLAGSILGPLLGGIAGGSIAGVINQLGGLFGGSGSGGKNAKGSITIDVSQIKASVDAALIALKTDKDFTAAAGGLGNQLWSDATSATPTNLYGHFAGALLGIHNSATVQAQAYGLGNQIWSWVTDPTKTNMAGHFASLQLVVSNAIKNGVTSGFTSIVSLITDPTALVKSIFGKFATDLGNLILKALKQALSSTPGIGALLNLLGDAGSAAGSIKNILSATGPSGSGAEKPFGTVTSLTAYAPPQLAGGFATGPVPPGGEEHAGGGATINLQLVMDSTVIAQQVLTHVVAGQNLRLSLV